MEILLLSALWALFAVWINRFIAPRLSDDTTRSMLMEPLPAICVGMLCMLLSAMSAIYLFYAPAVLVQWAAFTLTAVALYWGLTYLHNRDKKISEMREILES